MKALSRRIKTSSKNVRRNRQRRRLRLESLEDRRLLAIVYNYDGITNTLTFNSDGDGDTLILQATSDPDQVEFNAGLGSLTQDDVDRVIFNGNGGDDRLLISNPNGDIFAPVNGIEFNAGSGADDIVLAGGDASFTGSYTPTGSQSGNLTYVSAGNTQSIDFNQVVRIDDSMAASSFDSNVAAGNTVNVVDGPLLTPVASFSQGPVLIDGGDRDDHGGTSGGQNVNGWKFIEQSLDFLYTESFNSAPNDILSIGATGGDARAAVNSAANVLGLSVTHITGGAAISSVDFDDYAVLYVPSNDNNTSGGISNADLMALAARKNDIADFVRNGGGVMAQTEQGDGLLAFAWLEIPDPFAISGTSNNTMIQTPALAAAGFNITNAELTNGTPVHNDFVGPPGFNGLDVFVRNAVNEVITLGQGAIQETIGGGQALQINDGPSSSFPTINLANKTNIDVNAGGGGDSITVNVTVQVDGTDTIDVDAGAGDDTILVEATAMGDLVTVNGGGDDDDITVGGIATLDLIASPLAILGSPGSDTLTVDDSGDTDSNNYRITGDVVDRNSGGPLINYSGIEDLTVLAGSGDDTLDVNIDEDAGGGQPVTLLVEGGGGDDVFLDTSGADGKITPSLITVQTFRGGGHVQGDTVNLDMRGTTAPVIVDTVGGSAISQSHLPIYFTQFEEICLHDDAGLDRPIEIGHFYVRATGDRERIIFTLWNDGGLKLRLDNLDTANYNTFPNHFGLVDVGGGVFEQRITQITVYAEDGDDIVTIAGHVVDANDDPIPVDFRGEGGDDYLAGANGNDLLVGGPGRDRVLGGEGDNVLYGDGMDGEDPNTDGPDYLAGRSGDDILIGGGDDDYMVGSAGTDRMDGGSGDDLMDGGLDDDLLVGGAGNDRMSGYYGNDVLLGGAGVDRLFGRDGNNLLVGGDDADLLRGGYGDDVMISGTTALDAEPLDNDDVDMDTFLLNAALEALFQAWSGMGDASGATASAAADGDRDDLHGSSGTDEFWATVAGEEDLLRDADRDPGDTTNPI